MKQQSRQTPSPESERVYPRLSEEEKDRVLRAFRKTLYLELLREREMQSKGGLPDSETSPESSPDSLPEE